MRARSRRFHRVGRGPGRRHAFQFGYRLIGAIFLDKPDHRVEHDGRDDRDPIEAFAQRDRHGSGENQNPNHQAGELPGEDGERGRCGGLRDLIGTMYSEPAPRFGGTQPADGIGCQLGGDRVGW